MKQRDVSQLTLFKQLMIMTKTFTLLCVKDRKGKEQNSRENERRKCEGQSLGEKGIAWVQRSGYSHKQITEM